MMTVRCETGEASDRASDSSAEQPRDRAVYPFFLTAADLPDAGLAARPVPVLPSGVLGRVAVADGGR